MVMMLVMMMMMKTMILVLAIDGPFVGTHHFQGIRYRKATLGRLRPEYSSLVTAPKVAQGTMGGCTGEPVVCQTALSHQGYGDASG